MYGIGSGRNHSDRYEESFVRWVGQYIVDFCSPARKIIIEVDGGQHLEQEEYDRKRTDFLQSKGYRVLRFWDHEVLTDLNAVLQVIEDSIKPSP
ncbi:MAG: endonuclease domain-containing protein [Anaerolineaceae bacterium]